MASIDHFSILLIGFVLLAAMAGAALAAQQLHHRFHPKERASSAASASGTSDAYIISAVLGLLALLLGFTFSLAVERYEARRSLVLQEANAIGTSYLRSQALPEPDRSRMSAILVAYTDNRVALGSATTRSRQKALLAQRDQLVDQLWSATLTAYDSVQFKPFAASLLATVNEVIDMDSARVAARKVRVPSEVFFTLWAYMIITAAIIGYARPTRDSRVLPALLFILLSMSSMLILDIDRPVSGGITESQSPMVDLRQTLRRQPPGTFDRWRSAATSSASGTTVVGAPTPTTDGAAR
jgi:NADH:ubiquinone oxidoreductase subunit 5 (subunit L)/multisubunit Na+/H+ antiporter MnhA subunit